MDNDTANLGRVWQRPQLALPSNSRTGRKEYVTKTQVQVFTTGMLTVAKAPAAVQVPTTWISTMQWKTLSSQLRDAQPEPAIYLILLPYMVLSKGSQTRSTALPEEARPWGSEAGQRLPGARLGQGSMLTA